MPELDSALFSGKLRPVTEDDLAKCEINNIGEDITNVLTSFGWEGEPTACVLLQLTADNERVAAGSLVTRGQADREFIIDAGKVWQDANMGVTLTIRLPELDSFSFSDRGTASDFLPDEECVHFFSQRGRRCHTHLVSQPGEVRHRQVLHAARVPAVKKQQPNKRSALEVHLHAVPGQQRRTAADVGEGEEWQLAGYQARRG